MSSPSEPAHEGDFDVNAIIEETTDRGPADAGADRAVLDRRMQGIRPFLLDAAQYAGVSPPTDAAIRHDLAAPRVRKVLALIERVAGLKAVTDPQHVAAANREARRQGGAILLQFDATELGFAEYVLAQISEAGLPPDDYVVARRDALEHLIRRFRNSR